MTIMIMITIMAIMVAGHIIMDRMVAIIEARITANPGITAAEIDTMIEMENVGSTAKTRMPEKKPAEPDIMKKNKKPGTMRKSAKLNVTKKNENIARA